MEPSRIPKHAAWSTASRIGPWMIIRIRTRTGTTTTTTARTRSLPFPANTDSACTWPSVNLHETGRRSFGYRMNCAVAWTGWVQAPTQIDNKRVTKAVGPTQSQIGGRWRLDRSPQVYRCGRGTPVQHAWILVWVWVYMSREAVQRYHPWGYGKVKRQEKAAQVGYLTTVCVDTLRQSTCLIAESWSLAMQ